ncbi:MAG TPA: diacylglycerol kinase [Peptococcaceae bacterium]|nr:MAG: putative lipid kinase [Clostridia bacterium 41_269]HBT20885.1 diacylglycerol kinase [Peptococcaceae bacterium]
MERAVLIYNPSSGKISAASRLHDIIKHLLEVGFEILPYPTTGPGDAQKKAAQAAKEFKNIIAVGGDGTLHEIVNGLGENMERINLGIIPAGTSNDFARALDIPTDIEGAVKVIGRKKIKKVDVGMLNDRYFINVAGGGNLTNISYEVPRKLKTYLGQLAYYAKSLEELPKLRPFKVHIKTPELTIYEDIMLFLTANSRTAGGFELLAPKASFSDGLLDLIVVKKLTIAEFISLAAICLSGEHINHPKVIYIQTSKVEVTSSEKVSLNTDGEYAGNLPCFIKILPKKLNIFIS